MNQSVKILHANPLLEESALPFRMPPFDRVEAPHFEEAFEEAMRTQLEEVAAIAGNPDAPTFENTLVALERSGALLRRVAGLFFNLVAAHSNEALEAVQRDVSPRLAKHRDEIMLNRPLFERVDAIFEARGTLALDAESDWLVVRYHRDFVRAGARLAPADQAALRERNARLAALSTRFGQNVRKEARERALVVDTAADLEGLSAAEIEAARAAAVARGLSDQWLIPLLSPTQQPALASLKRREVRRRLYEASLGRCSSGGEFDNRATLLEIARLRAERARLLGFSSHADFILADETAGSVAAVNDFLAGLAPRAVANAHKEAAELQAAIDAEGGGFALAPYDWDYYAERIRSERFALDDGALSPYLEVDSVLQKGAFFVAEKLYGLTFRERFDLPVYHPDVRTFEVFDADGSALALFLFDCYARDSKKGGAWMNMYVGQSALLGALPVIGNHQNVQKPPAGEPTLLTFEEVVTLFHEFGHALHGMLSQVRYPRFSGTSVPRDFVEFPSQVNEMWATWPEALRHFARHHETGAPMPEALIERMLELQRFNQGYATTEYLAAALLDQAWHQLNPEDVPGDVLAFETMALERAGVRVDLVPPRYRSTYFNHIFDGGYAAGYYAYLWSEVLDADGAAWFKLRGGLSRENGDWLRRHVLSRGGSADARVLFRNFMGRDPDPQPLLERRGLLADSVA